MPTEFTTAISGNYKMTAAKHNKWKAAVITNGDSWPVVFGSNVTSSSDIYRLGIIPAYTLAAPTTTAAGTSTAGTYGIRLVYRSTLFTDGLTTDDIQGNGSNTVDVTLTAAQAAVLTKVLPSPTDSKIDALDVYAATKTEGVYGTFYRVVKDATNAAGTITFNILDSGGYLVGAGVTGGTLDDGAVILATDNDYPVAQPFAIEVAGRLVLAGGLTHRVTGTFTNALATITTAETIYDGIEFFFIRRDTDTTGGIDGKGTYLCRYATSTSVTLVDAAGAGTTYAGTSGSGTASIWTRPNRRYSKLYNPHAFPSENVADEYPSAILAAGKVPNTYRVLMFGVDWVVAEDYDQLPMTSGINYLSTEDGCSSHFSVVAARGRLYWLDLGRNKRRICMSDGTSVTPISTQKIRSILDRVTLDENGDVWRVGFIHGEYYAQEETIRWGLYLDNNTVANFVLELDLVTGDVRGDPQFYPHRYLDAFTFGRIRGRNYVGQFGSTTLGVCRLGLDNVSERYYDWADGSTTLRGDLHSVTAQTTTVFTIASGTLTASGDGLKGIQALIWYENYSSALGTVNTNPTYYHCRISANTASTFTVDYVETMDCTGAVSAVGVALPTAPTGSGWKWAVGGIQAIIGPKWFTTRDDKTKGTFRELAVVHQGQALLAAENPVRAHSFENFDVQPKESQYLLEAVDGQQVADTTKYAASFSRPQTNPVAVMGFSLIDNNVNRDTTALNIEAIILDWNEAQPQGG